MPSRSAPPPPGSQRSPQDPKRRILGRPNFPLPPFFSRKMTKSEQILLATTGGPRTRRALVPRALLLEAPSPHALFHLPPCGLWKRDPCFDFATSRLIPTAQIQPGLKHNRRTRTVDFILTTATRTPGVVKSCVCLDGRETLVDKLHR